MSGAASVVAGALCNSGCLRFGSFKTKSGLLSPYYIDFAGLLSSPEDFCSIVDAVAYKAKNLMTSVRVDKLASIELKGALILPSVSCRLNMPCVVVRKKEKTYGIAGRLAGSSIDRNDRVLFFDDVVSEGLSKLEGIEPLEELGARVDHVLVVVDREQGGKQNLEKLGYKVHPLAKISELVRCLLESGRISDWQAQTVLEYVKKR